jgi:hypothetical protein
MAVAVPSRRCLVLALQSGGLNVAFRAKNAISMKILALILFAIPLSLVSQEQKPEPTVAVISQLKCGSDRFAVLQVSNSSGKDTVSFPLSPFYPQGYTVHDLRMEVKEDGKWHLVGRGSDVSSSGIRVLRPGESFLDLFQLPTPERGATLSALPMRLVVPYQVASSYRQGRTKEFYANQLPLKNDIKCPSTSSTK